MDIEQVAEHLELGRIAKEEVNVIPPLARESLSNMLNGMSEEERNFCLKHFTSGELLQELKRRFGELEKQQDQIKKILGT